MADRRQAKQNWLVADESGTLYVGLRDGVTVAVLMDIRDELQKLNALLHCTNFTAIPSELRAIKHNTTKKKKTR